jgi:hypothetical protein
MMVSPASLIRSLCHWAAMTVFLAERGWQEEGRFAGPKRMSTPDVRAQVQSKSGIPHPPQENRISLVMTLHAGVNSRQREREVLLEKHRTAEYWKRHGCRRWAAEALPRGNPGEESLRLKAAEEDPEVREEAPRGLA